MAGYIVRSPVKWGTEDGSVVWLQPGEELPPDVPEEERLQLLAAGTVVPAETHKAVEEHDEKVKQLQEKRAELDAEQGRLYSEEGELQAEAERKLEEAKPSPPPERGVVVPKPAAKAPQETKSDVDARQTQQKADTAGKPAPTQEQSKADQSKSESKK